MKSEINKMPHLPGVYMMKDDEGEVIYIGKAKDLRKRVSSYFNRNQQDIKTSVLVSHIDKIDFIITETEAEALVLECNLIKKHVPRFNVDLKDNKTYPYIKVTINEDYPRVLKTRTKRNDGCRYFGPYPSVYMINQNITMLNRLFKLKNCKRKVPVKNKNHKPCLNYHIERCSGACTGDITPEEYKAIVKKVMLFLNGRYRKLVARLKAQMRKASKEQRYELAATYRDQINAILSLNEKQLVYQNLEKDIDLFGLFSEDDITIVVMLFLREGKLLGKRSFTFKDETNLSKLMSDVIKKYYTETKYIPTEIVVSHEIEDEHLIQKWLSKRRKKNVLIRNPRTGKRYELIKLAIKNAKYTYLDQKKITEKELVLVELKSILSLDKEPRRIEGFDIATTHGLNSVASMVSFYNAVTDKKNYRIFKIKSVEGVNDYEMMQEAVARRYQRLKNEKREMPDLILIDGGKGQLSSVLTIMQALELEHIPVIALAKKDEHIFVPGSKEPIVLPRNSSTLRLLQEIRDEAHRFGNAFHRKLRNKNTLISIFDEIKGIGEIRKSALLSHFKTISDIKNASVEELKAVSSMDTKSAKMVYDFFHEAI